MNRLARQHGEGPRISVICIHRQNSKIVLHTQACMMQQVQGLVNLFCSLSTLAMPNRKHFKKEEKNLHAVFASTLKLTTEPVPVTLARTRGTGRM